MICEVKFFDNEEDLKKLTGIKSHDELWNVGFNLDDWNWGFESSIPLTKKTITHYKEKNKYYGQPYSYNVIHYDDEGKESWTEHIEEVDDSEYVEWDETEEEILYENVPYFSEQLLQWMSDYCCGFESTEYNGKYYYMLYHA